MIENKFQSPFPLVVWVVILHATIIHIVKAEILLTDPSADGSIGLASLLAWIPNRYVLAAALIAAGMPALWSLWSEHKGPLLAGLCCLPQLGFLTITAMGAWSAVLHEHYADMVIRSAGFIEADQIHRMLSPSLYACAVYMRVRIAAYGSAQENHH